MSFATPYLSDPAIERITAVIHPIDISNGTDEVKRKGQRRAAVLMPLVMRGDNWHVILTQRPMHMPRHPGQISFPGGRVEAGETTLDAALRETEEEVGLGATAIHIIGRLDSFNAVSDFRVTPYVGIIDPAAKTVADPSEVADIFEVPLPFFMHPDNHIRRDMTFEGAAHTFFDMPYTDKGGTFRNVWGMTSMMIFRLYQKLHPERFNRDDFPPSFFSL